MKEIPLTQGKAAIVDDEDFEWLSQWKWSARKDRSIWYAVRWQKGRMNGKRILLLMHREILHPPIGMETDHKDGNGLNNQRSNLRTATNSQNQQNAKHRKGLSTFKGVSWHVGKWQSQIRVEGKRLHLGRFSSETEAAFAYDQAAKRYFGEFARTNF